MVGQNGESAFRAIFEGAPVAMWDEDFSGVKAVVDRLIESGISNIAVYLRDHPEVVEECVQQVRVRHVNRVAREFYGAETEQHLIAALPTLFDEDALEVFRNEVTAFAQGASSFVTEFSVNTLGGDRRRVVMNVSLVGDQAAGWSEVVVTFTDITERLRLEQSLKRVNESLSRVNQHLEQFAYASAHDMREPLRTIALYAQLLQRQQPPEAGSRSETALRYILDNASRMQTLVDDLLTFARAVEARGIDPQSHETDPRAVLEEALSILAMAVQRSEAQIHIAGDLPVIAMEAVHARQVFQNLLSNAIKYRAPDRRPDIHITAETSPGAVTFCVADNGIGIRPEYHQRIFGIFQRLHGHEIEGNGIGLALCRKIVEDYDGRIWVESALGEGARFYFTVPTLCELP